jgi:hypothetical protein
VEDSGIKFKLEDEKEYFLAFEKIKKANLETALDD